MGNFLQNSTRSFSFVMLVSPSRHLQRLKHGSVPTCSLSGATEAPIPRKRIGSCNVECVKALLTELQLILSPAFNDSLERMSRAPGLLMTEMMRNSQGDKTMVAQASIQYGRNRQFQVVDLSSLLAEYCWSLQHLSGYNERCIH